MFCSYRIWNKQFSRKKALLKVWIRQECCSKPLTNEFNVLMHLNSCLFKILRSNIYINLKGTDASIIFVSRETLFLRSVWILLCSTWNKKVGILDSKTFEVSRETNLSNSIFLTKQKDTKFFDKKRTCLKILRIKLQKRRKILKIKRKLRQSANILLKMGFVTIFISFFLRKCLVFYK